MTPLFAAVLGGDQPLLTTILSKGKEGLGRYLSQPSKRMTSGKYGPLPCLESSSASLSLCMLSVSMLALEQLHVIPVELVCLAARGFRSSACVTCMGHVMYCT